MPTLFIARSHSSLAWLRDMPAGWHVVIHDAAGDLDADALPIDATVLTTRVPGGLPAAYLHFLTHGSVSDALDVTVFCPDTPLPHSPDFFELLDAPHLWGDVQPLSSIGAIERHVPPPHVLMHDKRDQIADLAVRAERFSLNTLLPVAYFDSHLHRAVEHYRQRQDLAEGSNLLAHFLASCGLDAMAQQARKADIGLRAQGQVFGVRNKLITQLRRHHAHELARMAALVQAEQGLDLMFEHAWLHLLGESFIRFDSNERPDERTEPVDRAMARVVASIDAVLSQAVGAPTARTAAPNEALRHSVESLREQARVAAAAGRPDEAQRLLQQALLRQPGHVGVLTDGAGLAWQNGDLDLALKFGREGLMRDPEASVCAYVLGMALARRGEHAEARERLREVIEFPLHALFRHERPDLMEAASRELARLELLPGAVTRIDRQGTGAQAA